MGEKHSLEAPTAFG